MKLFIQSVHRDLSSLYPENEINTLIFRMIQSVTGFTKVDYLLHKNSDLSPENRNRLTVMLKQLAKGEPLQYVLGETEFYGLTFNVSPAALIPRPETEELVELIVKENPSTGLRVLDIGTGSGCIAIALAKNLKSSLVQAWDISGEALALAKENAVLNHAEVEYRLVDVLNDTEKITDVFDVIVSNPPYICETEAKQMHQNVLDFEPPIALFVPDNDPLLFYRKIAEFAQRNLHSGGKLYFEINAAFGLETVSLLHELGFVGGVAA